MLKHIVPDLLQKNLLEAINKGDLKKATNWIKAGADVNLPNKDEYTPLQEAAKKGNPALVREFITNFKGNPTQLSKHGSNLIRITAAYSDSVETVRYLADEHKVDPKQQIHDNTTIVYVAAHSGAINIMKCLIEDYGVDPKIPHKEGETPVFTAASHGNIECLLYLLEKCGLDPTSPRKDGITTVMAVVLYCKEVDKILPTLEVLTKYEADYSAEASYGKDAMLYAEDKMNSIQDPVLRQKYIEIFKYIGIMEFVLRHNKSIRTPSLKPKNDQTDTEPENSQVNNIVSQTGNRTTIKNATTQSQTCSHNRPRSTKIQALQSPSSFILKQEHLIDYKDLEFSSQLGSGGFGIVYLAKYQFNKVAVKQLHLQKMTPDAIADFINEINLMTKLNSPNIVHFYGASVEMGHYCLVMEYMNGGSLADRLHNSKVDLSWPWRVMIATDIVKGIYYLHSKDILHRDLKSLNVLLDPQDQAKLTDFGLSRVKTETASSTNQSVGTAAWMAPELFNRGVTYTKKSDIYSYGMVLWEVSSRAFPFKEANGNASLISLWLSKGQLEEIPKNTPDKISETIRRCWELDPEKRPETRVLANEMVTLSEQFVGENFTTKQTYAAPVSFSSFSKSDRQSKPNYLSNCHSKTSVQHTDQESQNQSGPNYYSNLNHSH